MGPEFILMNIGADFVDLILTCEIEATVARLDRSIKQTYPLVKRVFNEAEAWRAKDPGMQVGTGS